MRTKIEDLSTELWLEIFQHLSILDRHRAFAGLNARLNNLIYGHFDRWTCDGEKSSTHSIVKQVLPKLTQHDRDQMKRLRFESVKNIDFQRTIDHFHFPHVLCLTLHRVHLDKNFLNVIKNIGADLRCLRTSSLLSGNKNSLNELRHWVFSRPHLQHCTLRLGVALCPLPLVWSSNSPIETLRLSGNFEVCALDRLIPLLKYLPQLKTFHIEATDLLWYASVPLPLETIDFASPVKQLRLMLEKLSTPFDRWFDHFIRVMPKLESIEFCLREASPPQTELFSFLNLSDWTKLFIALSYLKQITLKLKIPPPNGPVSEKQWKRASNQLIQCAKRHHIQFSIVELK